MGSMQLGLVTAMSRSLLAGFVLATSVVLGSPGLASSRRSELPVAAAEGDVMAFGPAGGSVAGLDVYVAEHPSLAATTDSGGHWRIDGIGIGDQTTFALRGDGRYPIQTATFTMPLGGLDQVSFQSPSSAIVRAFESFLHISSEPTKCHLASTVTRQGYSLYAGAPDGTHGEPGATVSIEPVPASGATPVYFNGSRFDTIWPDRSLAETTADGGVLFVNVTPGTYTLRAHKAGAVIDSVVVQCIAGTLTNASPPHGLQVVSGGLGSTDTVPFPGSTTVPPTTAVPGTTPTPTSTIESSPVGEPAPAVPAAAAEERRSLPSYTG